MVHQMYKDGKIVDVDVICSFLKLMQALKNGDTEIPEGGIKFNSNVSEDDIRICDKCGGLVYTHSEHEDWWGEYYSAKCNKCGEIFTGGYNIRTLRRKTNRLKKASELSEKELMVAINEIR